MKPHSTLAIEASGLRKAFGETQAVDGVDLAVRRGSVYGMLGPNGAGKTTTVRMLATLLRPDEGEARVLGHDIVDEADAVRSVVSLTGQLASVDEDLTGRENLILIGRLLGFRRAQAKTRATALLEAFELADAAGRQVKQYSGGMRRLLDPEQRPEAERVLSRALDAQPHLEPDPAALSVGCASPVRAAEAVAELSRSGVGLANFSLGQPTLDEVFLALTGHPAEETDALEEPNAIEEEATT